MKHPAKPNIVLIMADQLAPQFLPCYGHPIVQTPAIDRLAANGVVFDAAYTNSPLCAPARMVMMSGRLPSKIAAWDNATEFSSEIPTFAHYLAVEGYHSCLSGKMHFVGPDQLHGFGERLTTDVYSADFAWHPEWDRHPQRLDWYHTMEVVTKAGVCTRSMYLDYDDDAIFKAQRFLFDQARQGNPRPFMLTVSMIQPHDPYLCRQQHWDRYNGMDIDAPRLAYGEVAEDPHSARLRRTYSADNIALDESTIRAARRAYYGSIADIDDKVAQLVNTISDAGFADNTIIMLTSDHGDMLGERGMWFKMSFFENSARVPLIVHAPALFTHRRIPHAVSLVDLLPTLVEIARNGKSGSYVTALEGRSLLPHLSGNSGHDEAIGEYYAEGTDTPLFMIRRATNKLIYAECDPLQCYDLAADPLERYNLATDAQSPDYASDWLREIKTNYDIAALKNAVLESQRRRKLIRKVMRQQEISWDFQPFEDASKSYVRDTLPIAELEKRARFP